jgi:hypothetical protein
MVNGRIITLALLLLLLVGVAVGILFFLDIRFSLEKNTGVGRDLTFEGDEPRELPKRLEPTSIEVRHSTQGVTSTYRGTITTSSPCETVESGIQSIGNPPRVRLILNTTSINTCPTTGVSAKTFSVSVDSQTAPVFEEVILNGIPSPYTLTRE